MGLGQPPAHQATCEQMLCMPQLRADPQISGAPACENGAFGGTCSSTTEPSGTQWSDSPIDALYMQPPFTTPAPCAAPGSASTSQKPSGGSTSATRVSISVD